MMTIFSLASVFMGTFAWFISIRRVNNEADSFTTGETGTTVEQISFHEFYGISNDDFFGFNPAPYSVLAYNQSTDNVEYVKNDIGNNNQGTPKGYLRLGTYSLDDPHHPVLMLFKVKGGEQRIVAKTKNPYLPIDKPGNNVLDAQHIVADYTNLPSSANNNEIYEVTNDSSQKGIYKDEHDNEYKIKTRYQYIDGKFKLVWTDLAMENNPLSSVAQSHYFKFSFEAPFDQSFNVNAGSNAITTKTYTPADSDPVSQGGIWIDSDDFTNDNESAFATFTDEGSLVNYEQEMEMFYGSTNGLTYVGVVVDYNAAAVEYVSSYYLGHPYLSDGLSFLCDWSTEI